MKKNYILATVIAGVMTSSAVFAHNLPANVPHPDTADLSGDSLINLPAHGSTVPSKSVDVWFVQIPEAVGYSVDLVGAGVVGAGGVATTTVCGPAGAGSADRVSELRTTLSMSDIACGLETSETKNGDGDVRGLHLCKWTTPDLPNGNYSLAINPIVAGNTDDTVVSQQEVRNNATCGSLVSPRDPLALAGVFSSLAPGLGNDTLAYSVNSLSARLTSGGAMPNGTGVNNAPNSVIAPDTPLSADTHYQRFTVLDATPPVSLPPSQSQGVHPIQGATLFTNLNLLEWHDPSGVAGEADWYEVWIYDQNYDRVGNFANDNPSFPNWYKVTVDPALSCQAVTGNGANRICTIDLNSVAGVIPAVAGDPLEPKIATAFAAANNNDQFHWYVRGYNALGAGQWSAAAMFRKN